MPNYRMVPGLVTEELDQEILVCDTDLAVVHRVSGAAADVLRQVIATDGAPVEIAEDEAVAGLVAAGVLVAADAPEREVGRRSFVRAAAAVGTIGVVTMALPRAAAAASDPESEGFQSDPGTTADKQLTQIQYPDITAPLAQRNGSFVIRWYETNSPFKFQVTITGSESSFEPVTVSGIDSGPTGQRIFISNWAVGETVSVSFVTTSLETNVSGDLRTTTRTSD